MTETSPSSTQAGQLFGECCKMLAKAHPDLLTTDDRTMLEAVATRALGFMDPITMARGQFIAALPSTGAIGAAEHAGSMRLLLAALARFKANPKPLDLHTIPNLALCSKPTQEEAITLHHAAMAAGFPSAAKDHLMTWSQAIVQGWDGLAALLGVHHQGLQGVGEQWRVCVDTIWRHFPPKHRAAAIAFLRTGLEHESNAWNAAARHALYDHNPLPLLLLVLSPHANIKAIEDTSRRAGKIAPVNTTIVERFGTAHGRLTLLSKPWDEHTLFTMPYDQANNTARAWLTLPTVRDARTLLKAQRQATRGRTWGPKGGDPLRRPTTP